MLWKRFGRIAFTLIGVAVYAVAITAEVHQEHEPRLWVDLWNDGWGPSGWGPDYVPWGAYLCWFFFIGSAGILWMRIPTLASPAASVGTLWRALVILSIAIFTAYGTVSVAYDSPVGEPDPTNASQALLAFGAIYLASLLALSRLVTAVRAVFSAGQTIFRRIFILGMALVLLLGLALGILGSLDSTDLYVFLKYHADDA